MTVATNGLTRVKFEQEVIAKNESLAERIGTLRKTVSDEQEARIPVEEQLTKLKKPVSASYKLAPKLARSDKQLQAPSTEVATSKWHVARADTEKAES